MILKGSPPYLPILFIYGITYFGSYFRDKIIWEREKIAVTE